MNKNKKKKLKKLIKAAFLVTLTIVYLICGEAIAGLTAVFDLELYYPRFPKLFSDGPADGEIQIHVIDVGQGDSILILSDDGSILIDAGTSEAEIDVVSHLTACKVKKLDYFICTHPHEDHLGGADAVADKFEIGCILMDDTYDPSSMLLQTFFYETERHGIEPTVPTLDIPYKLGDITFEFLSSGLNMAEGNDSSLIVKLTHGDMTFLFMGDSGFDVEEALLDSYSESELDCDFLKVGHHGSAYSTSDEFLAAVSPKIAAISCGRRNPHGHPSGFTLDRLECAGCDTIIRTDTMETVIVSSDGQNLTVISK